MLFTHWILIARRWKQFYHSMHPSRIDCRLQQKEFPLGQPLKLMWTQYHGGVLNAGNDCLFGKRFLRGPVKTYLGGKYLHDVIQSQSSFLYLPKGLESVCLVMGTEEKKGKAFDSMNLQMNE